MGREEGPALRGRPEMGLARSERSPPAGKVRRFRDGNHAETPGRIRRSSALAGFLRFWGHFCEGSSARADQPSDRSGKRVAILATEGVEPVQLEQPRAAVADAGADVELVSIHDGEIQARDHDLDDAGTFTVDTTRRS